MKLVKFSASLITAILMTGPVLAEGPYVSIMGGAAIMSDADNTDDMGVVITSEFDAGFLIAGAGGYGWANGLRVEGEIGYRQNDADQLVITNDGGLGVALGAGSLNGLTFPADGDVTALSVMANVAYDFKATPKLKPYVLAGLGFAMVSADVSANIFGSNVKIVDDDDTVFAWQIGGGIAFEVAPKVDIFADYRYFATADPSFTDTSGASFDSEYGSHNVSVGVRMSF